MIRYRLAERISRYQYDQGRKLTLVELADRTDINRVTLSRLMDHQGKPVSLETLARLCDFFDCTLDDLVEIAPARDLAAAAKSRPAAKAGGAKARSKSRRR